MEILCHTLAIEAVGVAKALHHPIVGIVARHLIQEFLRGDADARSLILLAHDVVLDHLFQSAVVDAIGLSGREIVVVGRRPSALKILFLGGLIVSHGDLLAIDDGYRRTRVSALTLEKVLQDKR